MTKDLIYVDAEISWHVENAVDCFIGDEMRTISLSDAIHGNEYNALQDLPGYAEHGAALWVEIDSLIAKRKDLL